jgi:hypothetical protein
MTSVSLLASACVLEAAPFPNASEIRKSLHAQSFDGGHQRLNFS